MDVSLRMSVVLGITVHVCSWTPQCLWKSIQQRHCLGRWHEPKSSRRAHTQVHRMNVGSTLKCVCCIAPHTVQINRSDGDSVQKLCVRALVPKRNTIACPQCFYERMFLPGACSSSPQPDAEPRNSLPRGGSGPNARRRCERTQRCNGMDGETEFFAASLHVVQCTSRVGSQCPLLADRACRRCASRPPLCKPPSPSTPKLLVYFIYYVLHIISYIFYIICCLLRVISYVYGIMHTTYNT